MLNRRHLRIKVLQELYAYFQSDEDNIGRAEKDLMQSIERIYDLYIYLLLSFSEIKDLAVHRIEEGKKKLRPTAEDLNPNLRLVENTLIEVFERSVELRKLSEQRKVNWVGDEHKEMFRKMFITIRESETYLHYMNSENRGFEEDKEFLIDLFRT
jgi:transcription antitermination protein NusB